MKIGISVKCATCGRVKVPLGRYIPWELYDARCMRDCPGYHKDPLPGDLWPDETEEEFWYPVSPNAPKKAGGKSVGLNTK